MSENLVAKAEIIVNRPISVVWDALTNPDMIKQFMFDTEVVTDWKEGSPILWRGVWQGKPYEDKGQILKVIPQKLFSCTHFSPLAGDADIPENYHTMTYTLSEEGEGTRLTLAQDGNKTEDEMKHSEGMWMMMLSGIKKLLESNS
jgi:uncharacterized protein YndB with AHSA1/START domain